MTLATDIASINADGAIIHAFAQGSSTTDVVTASGTFPSVAKRLSQIAGGLVRGAWVTATVYALQDVVTQGGGTYRCATGHTSGTFATDLAAGKWVVNVDYGDVLKKASNLSDIGNAATAAANLGVYLKAAVDAAVAAQNPVGTVHAFAGSAAPAGFLLCDGSAVSRATYAALFAALGTTFGVGDGSTTFNVPNLLGRMVVGDGTGAQAGTAGTGVITGGSALTARARGSFGGEESHALIAAELAAHRHKLLAAEGGGLSGTNSNIVAASVIAKQNNQASNEKYAMAASPTPLDATLADSSSTGSGTAHNTMPPFVVLRYIIRAL